MILGLAPLHVCPFGLREHARIASHPQQASRRKMAVVQSYQASQPRGAPGCCASPPRSERLDIATAGNKQCRSYRQPNAYRDGLERVFFQKRRHVQRGINLDIHVEPLCLARGDACQPGERKLGIQARSSGSYQKKWLLYVWQIRTAPRLLIPFESGLARNAQRGLPLGAGNA